MASFNNRRTNTLMLPSYWSAKDIAANAAMGNTVADLRSIQSEATQPKDWPMEQPIIDTRESTPRELAEDMRDYQAMRGNSPQMSDKEVAHQMADEASEDRVDEYLTTLDGEMMASLDANNNLSGDPIARGLTSDEEDAEVGRLWGIDASRVEFGE